MTKPVIGYAQIRDTLDGEAEIVVNRAAVTFDEEGRATIRLNLAAENILLKSMIDRVTKRRPA